MSPIEAQSDISIPARNDSETPPARLFVPIKTSNATSRGIDADAKVTSDIQVAPEPFIRTLTVDSREMLMMFPLPEADSMDREKLVALFVKNAMVAKPSTMSSTSCGRTRTGPANRRTDPR